MFLDNFHGDIVPLISYFSNEIVYQFFFISDVLMQ